MSYKLLILLTLVTFIVLYSHNLFLSKLDVQDLVKLKTVWFIVAILLRYCGNAV